MEVLRVVDVAVGVARIVWKVVLDLVGRILQPGHPLDVEHLAGIILIVNLRLQVAIKAVALLLPRKQLPHPYLLLLLTLKRLLYREPLVAKLRIHHPLIQYLAQLALPTINHLLLKSHLMCRFLPLVWVLHLEVHAIDLVDYHLAPHF